MLVDVRGFQPVDIKMIVHEQGIEIQAKQEAQAQGESVKGLASRTIIRTYQLPQQPATNQFQCSLSADGTLFICAPWKQCC